MNSEEILLQKRFLELAETAYQRNIPMFSDFLNLNEQDVFEQSLHSMPPISCVMMGGYTLAERKIAAFLPYEVEPERIPIKRLEIRPIHAKFSEELTHRDYLGALLNLGIERSILGDILVGESKAYVLCKEKMASYIMEQLVRIKHTTILTTEADSLTEISPRLETISGSVQSVRLDSVLAAATNISRSHIIDYIEGAKVFVNGRLITTNSYNLKEGDILSVRQVGRFRYVGVSSMSKKGRSIITIEKFI